ALLEELVVVVRDAEQLADHQRGHRQRQRLHQVDRPGTGEHGRDVVVDDLLDPRRERLDALDGELPRTARRAAVCSGGFMPTSTGPSCLFIPWPGTRRGKPGGRRSELERGSVSTART